jgi:hypothetical protein
VIRRLVGAIEVYNVEGTLNMGHSTVVLFNLTILEICWLAEKRLTQVPQLLVLKIKDRREFVKQKNDGEVLGFIVIIAFDYFDYYHFLSSKWRS